MERGREDGGGRQRVSGLVKKTQATLNNASLRKQNEVDNGSEKRHSFVQYCYYRILYSGCTLLFIHHDIVKIDDIEQQTRTSRG